MLEKLKQKFKDYFARAANAYKREVNLIQYYLDDGSAYLSKMRGFSREEARAFIVKNMKPGGAFEFQDPKVIYLERQENGDRVKKETTLSRYIASSLKNGELIAPTFTTYMPASKKKSILARFIEGQITLRNVAKKAMFVADAAGNKVLKAIKKVEQTFRKLNNNAISGAHCSASQPLFNLTAHSTLTSTCRSTSGYGNANNEKFLLGNRHYFTADLVLNNLVSITHNVDYAKIEAVMAKYGLHYPSPEEVMQAIQYSTSLYWWDDQALVKIREYVNKMTPSECAAFMYVGDAYQLMRHNEEMMRTLVTALSDKVTGEHENPDAIMENAPDSYVNLAHQICYAETKGIGKDYSSIKNTPAYHTLALTTEHVADTIVAYADLIEAFWMTKNLPASVAHFPASIRRSALTSDTDSTIFTVQDWVLWYTEGQISFDTRARGVYAAVVFLASSTITNVLATMSANFGIAEDMLFKIAMKSEYSFDAFIPSQLGKHYFAAISCQEGNVKKELEWEIKGAQFKSANAPRPIIAEAKAMMKSIIHTAMSGQKIRLSDYLTRVANQERMIIESIRKGERTYLRNSSIKDKGAYAGNPENSPYANHFLWQEVFAPKYGAMPPPPYDTKKVSVMLDNPTKLKAWLASFDDEGLRTRMTDYLGKTNRTSLTTFHLPVEILSSVGMPKEIEQVIDYDRIVNDICKLLYVILETLGYYAMGEKKVKRRLSANGW